MSEQNVIEVVVVPEVPKVVSSEEIYVYVPEATTDTKGIASFDPNKFSVSNGNVSVKDSYVDSLIEVQVSQLESEVDNKLAGKVDKLETGGHYVYSHNGALQTEIPVAVEAGANRVVLRDSNGEILVPTGAINSNAAVNASYVDVHLQPIKNNVTELFRRNEVYLTKDENGYVYMNEIEEDN